MLYSLIQLFSLPLIIKNMSMTDVTAWNILLPTGVLLTAIITFGMDSAIVRFVLGKSEDEKKSIFTTGFLFIIGLSLGLVFSLWIFSTHALIFINMSSEYLSSFKVLLAWLPGVLLLQFFQNWFKYSFQRNRFILLGALQSLIYLCAVLILRYLDVITLQYVMMVSLISIWIPGIVGLMMGQNMFTSRFDVKVLLQMLKYGFPFMLMSFGFNLIFSFDRYILIRNISKEEFAIYTQAFRIAGIFSMVISSFNFAFGPFSMSLLGKEDTSSLLADLRTYYLFIISLAGLCFVAISKVLIFLLSGSDYLDGYKFVPLFVAGYIVYGLYSFAQLGIIYSKRSHLSLYALAGGLLITICIDVFLGPVLKGYGTSIGFVLGMIVMCTTSQFLSKKYLHIESNFFKDIIVALTFVLLSVGSLQFTFNDLYFESLVELVVVISAFSCLFVSPLFKSERTYLQSSIKTLMRKKDLGET